MISELGKPSFRSWSKLDNATINKLRSGLTSTEESVNEAIRERRTQPRRQQPPLTSTESESLLSNLNNQLRFQRERSEAEARQAQPPTQTQSQDPEGQGKKSSKKQKKTAKRGRKLKAKTTSRTGLKYKLR